MNNHSRSAQSISTEAFQLHMTTATSSNAAAAALLGAILGDAAAQTSHWNYDRKLLVAADPTHGRRRWLVVEHSADETEESGDDVNDDDVDVNEEDEMTVIKNTALISAQGVDSRSSSMTEEVCTPIYECEICPTSYKVNIEKDDETIQGEYEACINYGRRQKYDCTTIFHQPQHVQTRYEYKSCQYTTSDEQYRMIRMQFICLLLGTWAYRNVKRLKVTSASLFDLRRMSRVPPVVGQHQHQQQQQGGGDELSGSNTTKNAAKFSRKNSMEEEMVVLIPPSANTSSNSRKGKVPKSPAPLELLV